MSTSKAAPPDKKKPAKAEPPADRLIVLLRHGIAEERVEGMKDEERSLTAEGNKRMKQIARGLAELLPKAQKIYSSPLLRCVQTSLWVSKGYRSRAAVTTLDVLAPDGKTKDAAELLRAITDRRIIVVGHEPNLTDTLRALTGIRSANLELKKGGCYGVRLDADGRGTLEWVLTPRVLRKVSE
jgi:phosphohistidine phosphatase